MFEEILLQFHHTKLARQLKNTITYILSCFIYKVEDVWFLSNYNSHVYLVSCIMLGLSAVCSGALSTLLFIGVEVNITIINHVPINIETNSQDLSICLHLHLSWNKEFHVCFTIERSAWKKTKIKIKIISRPIVDQLKAKRTFEERLYK